MSYILEALRKADRERNLGDVPDLEATHWGVRRTSRASHWPWVVAGLLLFNAALLVYLLGRDTTVATGQAVDDGISTAGAAAVNAPVPEEPLQRLASPVREKPRDMRPKVNYPPPATTTVQQARMTPGPTAQPQVVESSTPLSAGDGDSGLPEWSELPLEFRGSFALPHIDVHVFAEEPARRFVLIDLKKYREGDTLASGALLEKISPGSIQLFYKGTRFRVDR